MKLDDGKARIALYIAKNGNWFDGLINFGSGYKGFSHCELVGPDGNSFSSTTRDESVSMSNSTQQVKPKQDGTRWKAIDFNPDHWRFHDLPDLSPDRWEDMRCYANSILDARYDWWGAMRVAEVGGLRIPFMRQHADKYFCSEAVVEVLHAGDYFNSLASLVSPNRMAKKLELYAIA